MVDVHRQIDRRFRELERRPLTSVMEVDAGGAAWTSGNSAWIPPATAPEWIELRVANVNASGRTELYRRMRDTSGNAEWRLIA